MQKSQGLQGKTILFFLVDGFESAAFDELASCLEGRGATVAIASFLKGDTLQSAEGKFELTSDVSFSQATNERYDAVIVADGITARAIGAHPAALKLIEASWGRGNAVATVGEGALALIGAGIVDGARITSEPSLYDELKNSGADVSGTPVATSGNILSARSDADLQVLCDNLAEYIVGGKTSVA